MFYDRQILPPQHNFRHFPPLQKKLTCIDITDFTANFTKKTKKHTDKTYHHNRHFSPPQNLNDRQIPPPQKNKITFILRTIKAEGLFRQNIPLQHKIRHFSPLQIHVSTTKKDHQPLISLTLQASDKSSHHNVPYIYYYMFIL